MKRAWFFLICLLLATCTGRQSDAPSQSEEQGIYRPPPAAPQTPLVIPLPSPTPTPSSLGFRPTSTPTCNNDLRFVEDLTIPDGTLIAPGSQIDKRWQVSNTGTCNWDERYRLRLIEGPNLGTPEEQALYPARGGTQAVIRILFTAPTEPGTYRSAWQAYNPQRETFGDTIFVEFVVTTAGP